MDVILAIFGKNWIIFNTKTCSTSTMETPEKFVKSVNFEQISHIVLVFPWITLNE